MGGPIFDGVLTTNEKEALHPIGVQAWSAIVVSEDDEEDAIEIRFTHEQRRELGAVPVLEDRSRLRDAAEKGR